MADEVQAGANPSGDEAAKAVDAMFGAGSAEGGEQGSGEEKPSSASPDTQLPSADTPDRPSFVPEKFWTANEDGKTGKVNLEALTKAYSESESALTRSRQEIAGLTKNRAALPVTPDEYWTDLNQEELAAKAPAAFIPSAEGTDPNPAVKSLMTAAHRNGIDKETATKVLGDYFQLIDQSMERPKTEAELRAEAIGGLGPNGAALAQDVHGWVRSRATAGDFSGPVLAHLAAMSQTAGGLATLAALMRATKGSGAPDLSSHSTVTVDKTSAEQELFDLMGDRDLWSKNPGMVKAKAEAFEKQYGSLPKWMSPDPVLEDAA